jgi:hypothetical protein
LGGIQLRTAVVSGQDGRPNALNLSGDETHFFGAFFVDFVAVFFTCGLWGIAASLAMTALVA